VKSHERLISGYRAVRAQKRSEGKSYFNGGGMSQITVAF